MSQTRGSVSSGHHKTPLSRATLFLPYFLSYLLELPCPSFSGWTVGPSLSGSMVGPSVSGGTVGPSDYRRTFDHYVSGTTIGPSIFGGTVGPSVSRSTVGVLFH